MRISYWSSDVCSSDLSLGWEPLIEFMAFISINLGFINLLPVLMLDGGHLLFYATEAVRRRPVKAKAQELAFLSGLALLVSLMLLVKLNDLSTLGQWEKLANLAGKATRKRLVAKSNHRGGILVLPVREQQEHYSPMTMGLAGPLLRKSHSGSVGE